MAGLQYTIKRNRLRKAFLEGMRVEEDALACDEGEYHVMILKALDGAVPDCPWGRLCLDASLAEGSVCYLYAASSNRNTFEIDGKEIPLDDFLQDKEIDFGKKKRFLKEMGALRFINAQDVLLYGLEGRYLWIMLEVIGQGGSIKGLKAQAPGDNFMGTYPEVYRENNSFFHRYLSVFSTIYNEFQEELDHTEQLLEIDRAPEGLLSVYAGWLGIDVSGEFLEIEKMRQLLHEAGWLLKWKGTRKCLERLCEIVIEEKPVIVERSQMKEYVRGQEREVYDKLYGESPYDVTLLISSRVKETKKDCLLHLLRQFKPARSRLRIIFLKDGDSLDAYSYLDGNGRIERPGPGVLDSAQNFGGMVILQ